MGLGNGRGYWGEAVLGGAVLGGTTVPIIVIQVVDL